MEDLVCVILINYNGAEDTTECVKSLLCSDYLNIRIIIVDNASKHSRIEYSSDIPKEFCDIIYMKENLGFAGANNVGIQYAMKYDPAYVLIINNDTVVCSNFLFPLIDVIQNNPSVGIVTSKIYYYDEKDILWFGGSYYDEKLYECKIDGIGQQEVDRHNEKKEIPFATGCLWLIPIEVIHKVGLMCEDYFLYYEDADYCERVKRHGYKIFYEPKSVIYHKESKSTKKGSDAYRYYNIRNYLIFIRRFCSIDKRIIAYSKKWFLTSKDLIRHRLKWSVFICSWKDFIFRNYGKM